MTVFKQVAQGTDVIASTESFFDSSGPAAMLAR
jgi:hypothetical protein